MQISQPPLGCVENTTRITRVGLYRLVSHEAGPARIRCTPRAAQSRPLAECSASHMRFQTTSFQHRFSRKDRCQHNKTDRSRRRGISIGLIHVLIESYWLESLRGRALHLFVHAALTLLPSQYHQPWKCYETTAVKEPRIRFPSLVLYMRQRHPLQISPCLSSL